MQVLKAFHNDKKIKAKYLKRVRAHMKADELIRGVGFKNGKGCAVGCTLDDYDHSKYPTELGIPEWLARVEDTLFEGMSLEKSKTWPEKFLKSIAVGAKLEKVNKQFLIVVLKHSLKSVDSAEYDAVGNLEVKKAIDKSKAAVKKTIQALNGKGSLKTASDAATNAAYAASNAAYAASNAAYAASSAADAASYAASNAASNAAYAASNAANAARSAAYAASSAANAANAARSAAYAASSAANAASDAAYAARDAAYDHYADELLKLLKKA